tara:strand:+ start:670 stop:1749 length:1080 start_codon:yes stop_codon:yes gene_type:complete
MNKNINLAFNKLFSLFFLLILASCSKEEITVSSDEINFRNEIPYLINSNEPFTGAIKEQDDRGQILSVERFKDGKFHGSHERYTDSGVLESRTVYSEGNLRSEEYFDDETGFIKWKFVFDDIGNLIEESDFHTNGNLFKLTKISNDGTEQIKIYDEDGNDACNSTLALNTIMDRTKIVSFKNCLREGMSTYTEEDGTFYLEIPYKNDMIHGEKKFFYPDGSPKETTQYANGKRNGKFISYGNKGNIKETMSYKNDVPEGRHSIHYDSGEVKYEGFYQEGKSLGTWKIYHRLYNSSSELIDINDWKKNYFRERDCSDSFGKKYMDDGIQKNGISTYYLDACFIDIGIHSDYLYTRNPDNY